MRVPKEFRERHQFLPRPRHLRGHTHAYGVTVPAFSYPWSCSCGASGKSGGAGGHRSHVLATYRAATGQDGGER